MAAEQSQFSRLPKKQLVFISEKLIDEDFPMENPYETDFDSAYNTLSQIGKYFGFEVVNEDVEFFSKFLRVNDDLIAELFANNGELKGNKDLVEQLQIPVSHTYDLHYTVYGSCRYTDYLAQYFDCYDKDWVEDSATQQRNDGSWYTYDGRNIRETEYDDFQENDYDFDKVYYAKDKNQVQESILSKLVLENTSEVIDKIDRNTLIKLRNLINQKLSS